MRGGHVGLGRSLPRGEASSWIRIAGVVALVSALLITLPFALVYGGAWWTLVPAAAVAALLVGLGGGWLLFAGPQPPPIGKALWVGGLAGVVAHPLMWYVASVGVFFSGTRSSLGEQTLTPLEALPASLIYSLVSLPLLGWLTAPLGALGAGLVVALYHRHLRAHVEGA